MKRWWSSLGLLLLPVLFLSGTAHADVNDFTINSFQAIYTLDKSDPQGALTVDEHLKISFSDYSHGIYRAIPKDYDGHPLHVHVSKVLLNGSPEHYTSSSSNGNLVLKIGNADRTITGLQTYEIVYHVVNVIRFVNGHDELDWNVNGTDWDQSFLQVQATLHSNLKQSDQAVCYTGGYRSTAHDCTVLAAGNDQAFTTTRELTAGENMTFRADFASGTFKAYTFTDWLADYGRILAEAVGLPLVCFVLAFSYWRKNGRDIKGRGTIIPEYAPPDGLGPLAVDTIEHYKLSTKGITATIIDLSIRKYIRIIETDGKKLLGLGKTKSYSLQLLVPDYSALNTYEQQILDKIFSGDDSTVELSSLKNHFYTTAQALQKSLPADLTTQGYFARNPSKTGSGLQAIGFALIFVAFFLFTVSWALAVGLILSGIIVFVFATLMPRRTQKGVEAKDTLDGLKLYMEVAEKDRIAMLQSPDAPYAQKTDAPAQTVELFEKLLPYAMVLGVEQQWAKKFEDIYKTPPDWYVGNWAAFNTGYLVGSLNDSMGAMTSSFAAPSSSSSGSGGGFSGGGGGGGGGGGW